MSDWKDCKSTLQGIPFARDVEVECENGEMRIDAVIPCGSYSINWSGCIYNDKPKPIRWREIKK